MLLIKFHHEVWFQSFSVQYKHLCLCRDAWPPTMWKCRRSNELDWSGLIFVLWKLIGSVTLFFVTKTRLTYRLFAFAIKNSFHHIFGFRLFRNIRQKQSENCRLKQTVLHIFSIMCEHSRGDQMSCVTLGNCLPSLRLSFLTSCLP